MLEGIIFDYDGVIADSLKRQHNWFRHWAKLNNTSFEFRSFEKFREFYNETINFENGVQNVYDFLGLPCELDDLTHPVWGEYEKFKSENPVNFFKGIVDVIKELNERSKLTEDTTRNQKMRLGINTTNSWSGIYPELKREGILSCFDSYVSAEVLEEVAGIGLGAGIHKPSKVAVDLSLRSLNTNGNSTMYIGDSITDLRACINVKSGVGLKPQSLITVGCSWGYENRDRLEGGFEDKGDEYHFDHIIDRPKEILGIFDKYNLIKIKLLKI